MTAGKHSPHRMHPNKQQKQTTPHPRGIQVPSAKGNQANGVVATHWLQPQVSQGLCRQSYRQGHQDGRISRGCHLLNEGGLRAELRKVGDMGQVWRSCSGGRCCTVEQGTCVLMISQHFQWQ